MSVRPEVPTQRDIPPPTQVAADPTSAGFDHRLAIRGVEPGAIRHDHRCAWVCPRRGRPTSAAVVLVILITTLLLQPIQQLPHLDVMLAPNATANRLPRPHATRRDGWRCSSSPLLGHRTEDVAGVADTAKPSGDTGLALVDDVTGASAAPPRRDVPVGCPIPH